MGYTLVSKPLEKGESLNICTSNMSLAIRGTCGWVEVTDKNETVVAILEGTVEVTVTEPVSGQAKTGDVKAGETVICRVYDPNKQGDKCDIIRNKFTKENIWGFVLVELEGNRELIENIYKDTLTEIDLRPVTAEDAELRLHNDETAAKSNSNDKSNNDIDGSNANKTVSLKANGSKKSALEYYATRGDAVLNDRPNLNQLPHADTGVNAVPPINGGSIGWPWNPGTVTLLNSGTVTRPNTGTVRPPSTGTNTQPGSVTVTQPGSGTVTQPGSGTATPPDSGTATQPDSGTVTPPDSGTVTQPGSGTVTPPGSGTVTSPGSGTVTPPSSGTVTPPGSGTVIQPGSGIVTPPETDTITLNASEATPEQIQAYLDDGKKVTITGPYRLDGELTIPAGSSLTFNSHIEVTPTGTVTINGVLNALDGIQNAGTIEVGFPVRTRTASPIERALNVAGALGGEGSLTVAKDAVVKAGTLEGKAVIDPGAKLYSKAGTPQVDFTDGFQSLNQSWEAADDGYRRLNHAAWAFEQNTGTLTISGEGNMRNFTYNEPPWKSLNIQKAVVTEGIRNIGDCAFENNNSLIDVSLPDSLISIGFDAFMNCDILNDLELPKNLVSIDTQAFSLCRSLTNLEIPESVKIIGSGAFGICHGLKSVKIPDGVTRLGDYAFQSCTNLTEVTIPKSLTKIEAGVFVNCSKLANITLPESITEIGQRAFKGCTKLTGVKIPDNVTKIDLLAFAECSALNNITLPPNIESVGYQAFASCENLTDITLPKNTDVISFNAFYGCKNLSKILDSNNQISEDNYLFKNYLSPGHVTIPEGTLKIDDNMFSECHSLTSVTIPESVTEIGYSAFRDCTSLNNVIIPDTVTKIGGLAFSLCYNLTNITLSKDITEIGTAAFRDCTKLKNISIPDSVTQIGFEAFGGCVNLTSISLPGGLTQIDGYTFSNCTSLSNINIPQGVTQIDEKAFLGCNKIEINFAGTQEQWQSAFGGTLPTGAKVNYNVTQPLGVDAQTLAINTFDNNTEHPEELNTSDLISADSNINIADAPTSDKHSENIDVSIDKQPSDETNACTIEQSNEETDIQTVETITEESEGFADTGLTHEPIAPATEELIENTETYTDEEPIEKAEASANEIPDSITQKPNAPEGSGDKIEPEETLLINKSIKENEQFLEFDNVETDDNMAEIDNSNSNEIASAKEQTAEKAKISTDNKPDSVTQESKERANNIEEIDSEKMLSATEPALTNEAAKEQVNTGISDNIESESKFEDNTIIDEPQLEDSSQMSTETNIDRADLQESSEISGSAQSDGALKASDVNTTIATENQQIVPPSNNIESAPNDANFGDNMPKLTEGNLPDAP